MSSAFSIQFYGCRGSFPTSGPLFQRYGGATPCVVVRAGGRTVVLDAGSGIVAHGRDLTDQWGQDRAPITSHIFLTHLHLDHILGLPFFGPMYLPDATVNIWGPRMGHFDSLRQSIEHFIRPPYFPVPLYEMQGMQHFHEVNESHSVLFLHGQDQPILALHSHPSQRLPAKEEVELEVRCMRGFNHPKCGVLLYKVTYQGHAVVYATDTEGYVHGDQRLVKFAQGADVLIHDAMYTSDRYISMPSPTQGYGHSTVEIAASVARKAGVHKLFLFHHDPVSTDEELDAVGALGLEHFPNSEVARDGLCYDIL